MGFTAPDLPPVDPAQATKMPFQPRMQLMDRHWGEYGLGVPKNITLFYIFKIVAYVVLGVAIVWLTTPRLGGLAEFTGWWSEPIVYFKLLMWTILFEITGWSSSSGPLAFKASPLIGGILYYARRGTIRIPPWPRAIPLTKGSRRSAWDVALYYLILLNIVFLIVFPGGARMDLVPDSKAGLQPQWALYTYIALICIIGLRDKIVFLTSRAEQYLPVVIAFAVLPTITDMILAAKIIILTSWIGAAVSKLGRHFSPAVAAMLANTPWIPARAIKRASYKHFPDDLRPSKFTTFMAHVPGTALEGLVPLVLLFSTNPTVTAIGIVLIFALHIFITSTIPLAVPLEWNVFFMFSAWFLFWNFPAWGGYGVTDFSSPWIAVAVVACMVIWPILGNIKPEWISFLVSYRQYAGNWSSGIWVFKDRATEEKLDELFFKSTDLHSTQLYKAFGPEVAEVFLQKMNGWRTMHSMGRAMFSIVGNHSDLNTGVARDGEPQSSSLIGWQFGDGHLHDERLISAVQEQVGFAPGDLVIMIMESEPIHRNYAEYRVIDAALGVVERGTYRTKDSSEEQPWLPNGPVPYTVTWTKPGYTPTATTAWLREGADGWEPLPTTGCQAVADAEGYVDSVAEHPSTGHAAPAKPDRL